MTYSTNKYLTLSQMKVNAQYILNYLSSKGWTKNSICGMLGNMQRESTINPGIWQNLDQGNTELGRGLVQWTPSTNLTNWANARGLNPSAMDTQLKKILDELKNNQQWIATSEYPQSFRTFTKSKQSPETLAEMFCLNYERAGVSAMQERKDNARYWYSNLKGGQSGGGYQLAEFPMDIINISQGENGQYSHQGTLCIDFVNAPGDKFPYYAPCDCTCIAKNTSDAYLIWKSDKKVMCADGEVRYITWSCFHEVGSPYSVGKKLKKGELMGHSGIGGNVTGDHAHFNIIEGSKYTGFAQKPGYCLAGKELHIYDVWAISEDTQIVNGNNYDWKTSDWKDGETGDGGGSNNDVGDLITLLVCDALNGWKL